VVSRPIRVQVLDLHWRSHYFCIYFRPFNDVRSVGGDTPVDYEGVCSDYVNLKMICQLCLSEVLLRAGCVCACVYRGEYMCVCVCTVLKKVSINWYFSQQNEKNLWILLSFISPSLIFFPPPQEKLISSRRRHHRSVPSPMASRPWRCGGSRPPPAGGTLFSFLLESASWLGLCGGGDIL
jgi:hypothetical protein